MKLCSLSNTLNIEVIINASIGDIGEMDLHIILFRVSVQTITKNKIYYKFDKNPFARKTKNILSD